MLNALSAKRVYLSKSPMWQLYRMHIKNKANAIEVIKSKFLINSKLLAATIMQQYSTRQKNQRQGLVTQMNQFILNKINDRIIRVDYNILRLFAFLGLQETLKRYNQANQNGELAFKLTRYQQAYLQKLSLANTSKSNEQAQTRIAEFLGKYEQQLNNDSFDQLDDLIVANIPNSQTKIYNLCKIKRFYWAQDQHNILSLLNYVYQQIITFQWRNIQTISTVLSRISSSKANNKYKMLDFLDQLLNKEQRPFSNKNSFGRNDFLDQKQETDIVQYQGFLWLAILTLKNISTKMSRISHLSQKDFTRNRNKFIRILKSLDVRQKSCLLEMIAFLSVIKNAYSQIKIQQKNNSKFNINSLKQLKSQSYIDKQIEYFIAKYENSIKNVIFNSKNTQLLETALVYKQKISLLFKENIEISSDFLNQRINSEFQKVLNQNRFIAYTEQQRKTLLQIACILKDQKILKHLINKIQIKASDKQIFMENRKFNQASKI